MTTPLNILLVEDSETDGELLLAELRRNGFDPQWKRVETEVDYRANLTRDLDLIFSDFSLPQFSTVRALELLRESQFDTPFIIVSGTIGEDRAVESLKLGATDYVLKGRLTRLGMAVQRALRDTRERAERKRLEEQLRQSQKMEAIGQLAGGVAHDFNNILAAIQLQSELLRACGPLTPQQDEFVGDIGAATQRAAALTRQLLLFSRRERLQPCELDLSETVRYLAKMLRRILGEHIRLEIRCTLEPLYIHADPVMVDQVLMNLLVNSRDAMPGGGQIVVETSVVEFDDFAAVQAPQARPGAFACLSVTDTGCGIAPNILPRIFDPFFTTKDVGKGTGLGLSTVFGIVQQHRGWINVYSEPGRGTTFRIYLPQLSGNAEQQAPQPAPVSLRGGSETILLVEDDPALRAAMRGRLSLLGYRVFEAASGVRAMEVWQRHHAEIDLLFTDLVMPDGMTGKVLAQRLLKDNPALKVIYTSGYSAEIAGHDLHALEGINFLAKPYPALKLAQTVRNCLDHPRPE